MNYLISERLNTESVPLSFSMQFLPSALWNTKGELQVPKVNISNSLISLISVTIYAEFLTLKSIFGPLM